MLTMSEAVVARQLLPAYSPLPNCDAEATPNRSRMCIMGRGAPPEVKCCVVSHES